MKLSIVIPVYNSSNYLDDCLGSLLDQDLNKDKYEIICVNDGSTDNSLDILKLYAEKHQNIKVINQENKGHSTARNVGLKAAKGKYVWFVDSDDFIDGNSLSTIISYMEKNDIDFLTIGLRNVLNETHYNISKNLKSEIILENQPHNFACSGNRIFYAIFLLKIILFGVMKFTLLMMCCFCFMYNYMLRIRYTLVQ
jgi:glycosyltransferase involved in cell wall biosynthesis